MKGRLSRRMSLSGVRRSWHLVLTLSLSVRLPLGGGGRSPLLAVAVNPRNPRSMMPTLTRFSTEFSRCLP